MKEVRYTYLVSDPLPEDFFIEVEESRLKMWDQFLFVDGKEMQQLVYDEEGTLVNRTEFEYDADGRLIKHMDFMIGEDEPFKVEIRTYSPTGKILTEEQFHGEEIGSFVTYEYDQLDRLVEVTETDEDRFVISTRYVFEDNSNNPSVKEELSENGLDVRTSYRYNPEGKVMEERVEKMADRMGDYIERYYWHDEKPNDVFSEKYNAAGDFIEEIREVHDANNNLLRHSVHITHDADDVPYVMQAFEYDSKGNCTSEILANYGVASRTVLYMYNSVGKLIRKMESASNSHTVTYYKYENQ